MKRRRILAALIAGMTLASSLAAIPNASAANIPSYITDPDGNGLITINDAVVIESYLLGINEPTNLSALDFDKNGIISAMDSKTVQFYLANMWIGG